jgi:hypothetical protein
MTKETVTIVTLSTEEVQAIRSVCKIAYELCDLYDWNYDHHYIQDINNEKVTLNMRNLEIAGGFLENLTEFIFDENKIQIVEK